MTKIVISVTSRPAIPRSGGKAARSGGERPDAFAGFPEKRKYLCIIGCVIQNYGTMKKRTIFTLLLSGAAGLAQAAAPTGHVQSATAVSRVLGDGRKVETVVLEYDAPVRDKSLTAESYAVEGREMTPERIGRFMNVRTSMIAFFVV